MWNKFGLVILIVIFGSFTFIAGLMAPDAPRHSLYALAERALGQTPAPPVVLTALAPPASGAEAPAPAASAPALAPVRLDSLLVTAAINAPVPDKGKPVYALQLGQFATAAEADATLQRVKTIGLNMPLAKIATLDSENEPWCVVALGQFVSAQAAVRAAPRIQNVLDLHETPVIQLPPSEKASP